MARLARPGGVIGSCGWLIVRAFPRSEGRDVGRKVGK